MPTKKIFVLEGEWENHPKHKGSTLEMLRFLKATLNIDYFHRRVATKEEFFYHLKSKKKYKGYDIICLAFHGSKGSIYTNDYEYEETEITLDDLQNHKSFFKNRILHISSCKTLKFKTEELLEIKKELELKSLSGYTKNVDWIDSALFDIALFQHWQNYEKRVNYLNNFLQKNYSSLYERLGFIMV